MAKERTAYRVSKSIVGLALVSLGVLFLYENVAAAIAWYKHVLTGCGPNVLASVPSVALAVAQALQTHAADHRCLLQEIFERAFVSSWPVLLVASGTLLSRD